MAKDFWTKYKDPRWQKRRLEIMELSGWRCGLCNADNNTLNVHHKFYRRGADPWDYADHELQCLCEGCHEHTHDLKTALSEHLARLSHHQVLYVMGYSLGLKLLNIDPGADHEYRGAKDLFDRFGWEIYEGVGDLYGLNQLEMDDAGALREDGVLDGQLLWDVMNKKRQGQL